MEGVTSPDTITLPPSKQHFRITYNAIQTILPWYFHIDHSVISYTGKVLSLGDNKWHSLLQGIFPTQGSNSDLLHCRQIMYHWDTREAPLEGWNQAAHQKRDFGCLRGKYNSLLLSWTSEKVTLGINIPNCYLRGYMQGFNPWAATFLYSFSVFPP